MFENVRADFRAHGSSVGAQGFWALLVYRFGRWRYGIKSPLLRKPMSLIYHVLFKVIQVVAGIQLPCEVSVGKNLVIDHFGPIIVNGYSSIGDNCRLRTGVVIGIQRVGERVAPVLGNNVDIGVGAKILGGIRIGDDVLIGANAVVVSDVPSNSIAVGVPAKAYPRDG